MSDYFTKIIYTSTKAVARWFAILFKPSSSVCSDSVLVRGLVQGLHISKFEKVLRVLRVVHVEFKENWESIESRLATLSELICSSSVLLIIVQFGTYL